MTGFVATPVPPGLLVHSCGLRSDYADCYQARLAAYTPFPHVDQLARLFFSDAMPGWVRTLLSLRNRAVRRFGLKGDGWEDADPRAVAPLAVGDKVGPWTILARSPDEIVLADDDRHLRFAFSLRASASDCTILATTVVELHNLAGRAYFVPVKPFHRLIVPRHMASVLNAAMRTPAPRP